MRHVLKLRALGAVVAVAACAARVSADDSVFGIRGLGLLGRPVSARSAGAGGAFSLFDPAGPLNPASLGRWRTMVGWAVAVPTRRSYTGTAGDATLTSTRFPLFGFATIPGRKLVIGMTVSEYLNRTWGVRDSLTVNLGGADQPAIDLKSSVGGVTDLRFGAAYHVSASVDVGVAFHALAGSTRSTVVRDFSDSTYTDFGDIAVTDYTGRGLSIGVNAEVVPRLLLSGSVRVNSALTARTTDGERARVSLPTELAFGVLSSPLRGVSLAVSAGYASWSSAADDLAATGEERSRDVWNVSVGTEFDTFRRGAARVPVRLGYRWRQLPFPVQGATITESAFSGGFAIDLAGGRTTLDLAVERGSRAVGAQRERFTSGFIGVILRP
jgi:hypothetical protein